MTRTNPCKGREAGCTADPKPGATRCDNCKRAHNERERARRKSRRKAHRCTVCGARAVVVNGVALATCQLHREYFAERSALQRVY